MDHTFLSVQMYKHMQEKQLIDAMNRLTEELYQFRVMLTPELRKMEVLDTIDKQHKDCLAAVRRKTSK